MRRDKKTILWNRIYHFMQCPFIVGSQSNSGNENSNGQSTGNCRITTELSQAYETPTNVTRVRRGSSTRNHFKSCTQDQKIKFLFYCVPNSLLMRKIKTVSLELKQTESCSIHSSNPNLFHD